MKFHFLHLSMPTLDFERLNDTKYSHIYSFRPNYVIQISIRSSHLAAEFMNVNFFFERKISMAARLAHFRIQKGYVDPESFILSKLCRLCLPSYFQCFLSRIYFRPFLCLLLIMCTPAKLGVRDKQKSKRCKLVVYDVYNAKNREHRTEN